jgi:uncharacterized C2H2 Zn-finger protein
MAKFTIPQNLTETELYTCKICGKVCKSSRSMGMHVKKQHGLLPKDYYDKFYKKESDGKCEICGKPTKFGNFNIINFGYNRACCQSCAQQLMYKEHGESVKLKRQQTCIKKYGVDNPSKVEEIKKKLSDIANKNFEDENLKKEIVQKRKKTMKERYGGETTMESKELVDKVKSTNKEKYGSEWVQQTDEMKQRLSDTWNKKFEDDKEGILNKRKEAWMKIHGVDNPSKVESVKQKLRKTWADMKLDGRFAEYVKKVQATMRERYGVDNIMDLPEYF